MEESANKYLVEMYQKKEILLESISLELEKVVSYHKRRRRKILREYLEGAAIDGNTPKQADTVKKAIMLYKVQDILENILLLIKELEDLVVIDNLSKENLAIRVSIDEKFRERKTRYMLCRRQCRLGLRKRAKKIEDGTDLVTFVDILDLKKEVSSIKLELLKAISLIEGSIPKSE